MSLVTKRRPRISSIGRVLALATCASPACAQYSQIYDAEGVSSGSGDGAIWLWAVVLIAIFIFGSKALQESVRDFLEYFFVMILFGVISMWAGNYFLDRPKGTTPSWLGLILFGGFLVYILKDRK
jgi:hypothetical protein